MADNNLQHWPAVCAVDVHLRFCVRLNEFQWKKTNWIADRALCLRMRLERNEQIKSKLFQLGTNCTWKKVQKRS